MRRLLQALLLLTVSVLLTGCIAEFLAEGGAVEGLAGAEGAIATAEAAEAAAVAAAEPEVTAAFATRVASGELSVDAGALRSVLADLTDGGAVRTLDLDSAGILYREGRALAQLEEDGAITVERMGRKALVGRVADGRLWRIDAQGGLRQAIGELRGFVPGSGVELYDSPSGTSFRVLDPHSVVEVLERRGGWIEIRLVSGERGWVWSPLVAVTALLQSRRDRRGLDLERVLQPGEEERCVVLASGQLLRGHVLERVGSATRLQVNTNEQVVIDDTIVARAEPCRDAEELDWTAGSYTVPLQSGAILYARSYETAEGAVVLTLGDGARVIVSRDLLNGVPITPRALVDSVPRDQQQRTVASLLDMERSVPSSEPQPQQPQPVVEAEVLPGGPAAPVGAEGWQRSQTMRTEIPDERWRSFPRDDGRAADNGFYNRGSRWRDLSPRYDGVPSPRDTTGQLRNLHAEEPRDERPSGRRRDAAGRFDGNGEERPAHPEPSPDEPSARRLPRDPRSVEDRRPQDDESAHRERQEGGFGGGNSVDRQHSNQRPPSSGPAPGWKPAPPPPRPPSPQSRPPHSSSGGSHPRPHG